MDLSSLADPRVIVEKTNVLSNAGKLPIWVRANIHSKTYVTLNIEYLFYYCFIMFFFCYIHSVLLCIFLNNIHSLIQFFFVKMYIFYKLFLKKIIIDTIL